jgi:AcrR family transcriptional regulator
MNATRANPEGMRSSPPGTGDFVGDNQRMSEPESDRPAYARVTRSHKGVDAEARRKERRERLIEAGLETLGTKGLHATTVRDVCGLAGLSERYFYESFSGLGELFGTIYQALHQELLGRLMAVLVSSRGQHQPALEGGKTALIVWFTFLKEDPRRARIMLIDAMGGNEGGAHGAKAAARDYVGAIQAFLDLLYPGLPAQHLSSRLLSAALLGACIHTAKEWIWSGFEAPMETIVAHLAVVFQALDSHYQRASIAQNAKS